MEDLRSAYYELAFRLRCRDTGDAFQEFFSTLMELRYPSGDFVRVRPWGRAGDRKNDGYLRSKRRLFQCFGPDEMKPITKCTKKVKADFAGALPYWKEYFDQWIFVHNDARGLPPQVLEVLLELTNKHTPVKALHWSVQDLLAEYKGLNDSQVATLLGPAPGRRDVVGVRVEDVKRLLEHIALQPEPAAAEVRPVPAHKLQHNQLSDAAATLLKIGMTRADIVRKYLRGIADQTRHDKVAAAFTTRYNELKSAGSFPDDIFAELQKFVAGETVATPSHQAATLAILAFFFETCDIFERPPVRT